MKFSKELEAEVNYLRYEGIDCHAPVAFARKIQEALERFRKLLVKAPAKRDKGELLIELVMVAAWAQITAEEMGLCPRWVNPTDKEKRT